MRKNGVIRGIAPIKGGVCAPTGFTACGYEQSNGGWGYAIVKSEERLPAAFSCTESGFKTSALAFAEKRFDGILRVFSVLCGVPDTGDGNSAVLAKELCVQTGRALGVPEQDVLPLIVGDVSKRLKEPNIKELIRVEKPIDDNSAAAARAICGQGVSKEGAFSFFIGDVPCRLGFIGKGTTFSSPDCAVSLITTDVNISASLLQKALDAEMKDSFGMLCLPDLPSPCDAVAVMASGKAGNYPISQADSDYGKFTAAFHLSCFEICKILARKTGLEQILVCSVKGARSKQSAREIAKTLAYSESVKRAVKSGVWRVGSLLCAVGKSSNDHSALKISAFIESEKGKLQILDEGKELAVPLKKLRLISSASEITLSVELKNGNYTASALATVE